MGGDDRDGPDTILLSRPPEQRLGFAFLMTRLSPERHVGEHDPTAAWVQPLLCVIGLDNAEDAIVERMDVVAEPPVSGHLPEEVAGAGARLCPPQSGRNDAFLDNYSLNQRVQALSYLNAGHICVPAEAAASGIGHWRGCAVQRKCGRSHGEAARGSDEEWLRPR